MSTQGKSKTKSLLFPIQSKKLQRGERGIAKTPDKTSKTAKFFKISPSLNIKTPVALRSRQFFDKGPEALTYDRPQKKHASLLESSSSQCTLDLQGLEEYGSTSSIPGIETLASPESQALLQKILSTPSIPQPKVHYRVPKKTSEKDMRNTLLQKFARLQRDSPVSPPPLRRETLNTDFDEDSPLSESNDGRPSDGSPKYNKLSLNKYLKKKSTPVKAYAANTKEGTMKVLNEDRVCIVVNIMKPPHCSERDEWPSCSFFGIYSGHGGVECAEFLQNNLHHLIVKDVHFPLNPIEAIRNGFQEAERQFIEQALLQKHNANRSGSCAIIVLTIGDVCYIANVGDSQAVMSCEGGKKTRILSREHVPDDPAERERILSYGGKIYRTQVLQCKKSTTAPETTQTVAGPLRVFPGRLLVSRTFGDVEAKLPRYGGIPGVLIADPEIQTIRLTKENDFIILASSGIFEKLSHDEVVQSVWTSTKFKCGDLQQQSSIGLEEVLNACQLRKSAGSLTAIMISLAGFEKRVFSNRTVSSIFIENEEYSSSQYDAISPVRCKQSLKEFGDSGFLHSLTKFQSKTPTNYVRNRTKYQTLQLPGVETRKNKSISFQRRSQTRFTQLLDDLDSEKSP